METLCRLAEALDVSVSFLIGEVPAFTDAPPVPLLGQASVVGATYKRAYDHLSPEVKRDLEFANVEVRISSVIRFLCEHWPQVFTPSVIAYNLGLSLEALDDVMNGRTLPGFSLLRQLAAMTGIPYSFLTSGIYEGSEGQTTRTPTAKSSPPPTPVSLPPNLVSPGSVISLETALDFAEPLRQAVSHRLSPEQVLQAIRNYVQAHQSLDNSIDD